MTATPLQTDLSSIATAVNLVWMLVATFLIFFMHAGFAMLEAGQVRSKNVANQLTKNMLTWSIGVIVFFLAGAAIASVVAGLTGGDPISLGNALGDVYAPSSSSAWVQWLFGAVFAMTAASIVSGAVAGRAKLRAYVTYTILLAAFIYPVVLGITWDGGFLGNLGYHDFAGGTIVHGMGGVAGLTAAWILGPRLDRYRSDGSANVIPGHSITFAVLGTLILAFGWYGFNVGTASAPLTANGTALASFTFVGRVALTTTLAMAAGAIGAGGVALYQTGKVDTLYVANGMLAGLVGITSVTDAVVWPGALVIGLIAGAQLPFVFGIVEKRLKIDDVCAVFPVHGSAGMLGALMFPLFATSVWNGGGISKAISLLGVQVVGVAVISLWTFAVTALIFGGLRSIGEARVSAQHEREGLDASEHGVDTYPEFGNPDPVTDGSGVPIRTDGGSGKSLGERKRGGDSYE